MQGALKQMNAKFFTFPFSASGFKKERNKIVLLWASHHVFYLSQDLYGRFIMKTYIKGFSNFTSCQRINPLGKCFLKLDKKNTYW